MYRRLDQTRRAVPASHFHEVRYEDLVADPLGEMQTLYARLGLGSFDRVAPRHESYHSANANYATNAYEVSAADMAEIESRCAEVIEAYGYR